MDGSAGKQSARVKAPTNIGEEGVESVEKEDSIEEDVPTEVPVDSEVVVAVVLAAFLVVLAELDSAFDFGAALGLAIIELPVTDRFSS